MGVWCHTLAVAGTLAACLAPSVAEGWGGAGHRIVARVAEARLSAGARRNIRWLLGNQTLAQVSVWADGYVDGHYQTGLWHYVNIPERAAVYDRDRDCPPQAGSRPTGRGSRWRDCVVDRIEYQAARLADRTLDRTDRAVALKFLVHLVADIHQPFHTLATGRGGNGIRVDLFGSPDCQTDGGARVPCNLHLVWDSELVRHRGLTETAHVSVLESGMGRHLRGSDSGGGPAEWAAESLVVAKRNLVANGGRVDDAYYARTVNDVDERLARAGLRLAALLNRALADEPPRR